MDKKVLEVVLKRFSRDSSVGRVLSAHPEPAVARGENYLSTISRLRLDVLLDNGRLAKKSLILKELPKCKALADFVRNNGVFILEVKVYLNILAEMERLIEEVEDSDGVLWCKLLYYQPNASILLEDLKPSGYKVVKRQTCLDLEHGLLALRNIARFHAMAKVLSERNLVKKNDLEPLPIISKPVSIKGFFHGGLVTVSRAITKYWGPSWKEAAQRLVMSEEELVEKILRLGKCMDSKFDLINHGDLWTSNIMFKYDFRNRPYSVRFVDFQWVHYNSCCFDLSDFFYLSLQPAVRRNYYNELINSYYVAFRKSLKQYGYSGETPTLLELKAEMDRVSLYGICLFLVRHAIVTTERTDGMDLGKVFETGGEEGFNLNVYDDTALIERMSPDIERFLEVIQR